jgi:hypothetical protein
MRKILILSLMILFLFVAGCTSYAANLAAPKPVLPLNHTAVFEQDDIRFNAMIDHVRVTSAPGSPTTITVHLTVRNVGTQGVSLVAYPKITDDAGTEYAGRSIFLGAINPGGMAAGESGIEVDADGAEKIRDHALLSVRFQNVKPMPSEATWYVDFRNLP